MFQCPRPPAQDAAKPVTPWLLQADVPPPVPAPPSPHTVPPPPPQPPEIIEPPLPGEHQPVIDPVTPGKTLATRGFLMPAANRRRMTDHAEGSDLKTLALRTLDHVGRGMLLVAGGGRVLYANRLARQALAATHALRLQDGHLQTRFPDDAERLEAALQAGLQRGLRHLLLLGEGAQAVAVAVLPIDAGGRSAVLVSLEQPRSGQDMAMQWYARQHNLTSAETAVLEALLDGQSPIDIATAKRVALSTVRTQIGQLRRKTGMRSIRQLLDRVGGLPPMMVVVQ